MKYPLAQVVLIKKKKYEEAERTLQEKKTALAKEEEKLKKVEEERDHVKKHKVDKLEQLRQELDKGSTTTKIQQMKAYLKVVDEQLKQKEIKVDQQKKQVRAAEDQVEIARQDFIKKQKQVEKLHMHRKEWDKEMAKEASRKEEIETNEMGSLSHARKKRESSS